MQTDALEAAAATAMAGLQINGDHRPTVTVGSWRAAREAPHYGCRFGPQVCMRCAADIGWSLAQAAAASESA